MSVPAPPNFSSRLTALAQRLGLFDRGSKQILQSARTLHLPFKALPTPANSICWHDGLPLQRLLDLPRGALSGPVQEDKAQAHAALSQLIDVEHLPLTNFDLRQVDGFACRLPSSPPYPDFESYAASEHCRQVRIISYKDFVRTISLALPRFMAGETIEIYQSSWNGARTYWAGDKKGEAFAGAIVYARRRELEVILPANLTRYRLSNAGLHNLERRYHVLGMPGEAWSEPTFMGLLLDSGLPYARLPLFKNAGGPELLLLPKDHPQATALGEGLHAAGAADALAYLRQLSH